MSPVARRSGAPGAAGAAGAADNSAGGAVGHEVLAFELVEPAPDAVGLVDANGVVEAGAADGADGADRLGALLAGLALVLALDVRRREEHRGLRSLARRSVPPRLRNPMCLHPPSLPPACYRTAPLVAQTRVRSNICAGERPARSVAGVLGPALLRFHLQQEPVDRHHPHPVPGPDRRRPVGAGPP